MNPNTYRPQQLCALLSIAPTTLRLWTVEFSGFLSPGATGSVNGVGQHTHRRFLESDVTTLRRVRVLLSRGLSYNDARDCLTSDPKGTAEADHEPTSAISTLLKGDGGISTELVVRQLADALVAEVVLAKEAELKRADDVIVELRGRLDDAWRERDRALQAVATAHQPRHWWSRRG